uniref:NADH dehydrogenase subunit 3 n=1 Tax=Ciconiphilus decimfasciatus TaxID=2212705 RepID=UPI00257AEC11|nr:NADH dehydrogenase subunit 3 [Ciconiphilus decimfasciatus]WGW14992.1 NADH dehydrogenase subunit 3 [Ciconiphilus decimfasciatus]
MINIFFIFMSLMFLFIFMMISIFFMENLVNESGESPFECGFEPISFSRIPFSLQFFSISIVFLIFDLEIVIILPIMKSYYYNLWIINGMISFIVILLFIGLIVEWYDGSLDWSI